jgi:outer membrane protein assembly factor BamB
VLDTQDDLEMEGITMGLDGTIYLISQDYKLYAISNEGYVKWSIANIDFRGFHNSSISFSPDGKILYLPGRSKTVYAFDLNSKSVLWSFGNSESFQAPIVDNAGNIYLHSQSAQYNDNKPSFYSLNPDGTVRWSYIHNDQDMLGPYSEPTIDRFGHTYFVKDTLYSLDYSGNLRWKYSLGGGRSYIPLVCDENNIIYVNHKINSQSISSFAIDSDKKLIWENIDLMQGHSGESPALGNNVMYLPTGESGDVFSIK